MGWPGFRLSQWRHIRSAAEKRFVSGALSPVIAFDRASAACDPLVRLARFPCCSAIGFRILERDFFDVNPADLTCEPGLVVVNPPYGKRMGTRRETAADSGRDAEAENRLQGMAVFPDGSGSLGLWPHFSAMAIYAVYHGGLQLELLVGKLA